MNSVKAEQFSLSILLCISELFRKCSRGCKMYILLSECEPCTCKTECNLLQMLLFYYKRVISQFKDALWLNDLRPNISASLFGKFDLISLRFMKRAAFYKFPNYCESRFDMFGWQKYFKFKVTSGNSGITDSATDLLLCFGVLTWH